MNDQTHAQNTLIYDALAEYEENNWQTLTQEEQQELNELIQDYANLLKGGF